MSSRFGKTRTIRSLSAAWLLWALLPAGLLLAPLSASMLHAQPEPPEEQEEIDEPDEPLDDAATDGIDEEAEEPAPDAEDQELNDNEAPPEEAEGEPVEAESGETDDQPDPEMEAALQEEEEAEFADDEPSAAADGVPPEEAEASDDEASDVPPDADDERPERSDRPMTARERAAERRRQAAERARERHEARLRAQERGSTQDLKEAERERDRRREEREEALRNRRERTTPHRTPSPTPKPAHTGPPETVVDVDIVEPDFDQPPEQKLYQFSFEDVEYSELLDYFSRMTGLPIIGDPPAGKVTFKTARPMDFKTALNRIRLLLFRHRDNYWLQRDGNMLEVIRLTELPRELDKDDIYSAVDLLRADARDPNDLIILLYTPERGSVEDLMMIRDYLPDYVRMAPLEGNSNTMSVFGLVKDVNKFLDLVDIFFKQEDPRVVRSIPVNHIAPSEAVEALGTLMDLTGDGTPQPRRRGRTTSGEGPSREIRLLPDDEQGVIVVRALPSDIEEIENLLPYIDVDPESDVFQPVIIDLKHVTADEMVEKLRPMLSLVSDEAAQPTRSRSRRSNRRSKSRTPTPAAPASTEDVAIIAEPRNNRLLVFGDEEQISRVRMMVSILDEPSTLNEPVEVVLEHGDASELAQKLQAFVSQARTGATFTVTPDEPSNAIWLLGNQPELDLAFQLIAKWDVAGDDPTLHKYHLQHANASEIAVMLSRIDAAKGEESTVATPVQKGKSRRSRRSPRRRTSNAAGRFIGEDATNIIYVLCTDEEWEQDYLPQIKALDEDARTDFSKQRIDLAHIDPDEAVELITQVYAGGEDVPQMLALPDAVLLLDAGATQAEQIRSLIRDIDVEVGEGIEKRTFTLEYADSEEVKNVVISLIGTGGQSRAAKVRAARRRANRRKGNQPAAVSVSEEEVTIVSHADQLFVRAPSDVMEEIAELIAELDVEGADETDFKAYPFPPSVNVADLATTLTKLYGGQAPRPRRGRKAQAGPTPEGVTFIPQPAANRILVSAPADMFPDIEEKIQLLATDTETEEREYKFISVQDGNADTVAGLLKPMLEAKVDDLVSSGRLSAPQAGGKGAPSVVAVEPDPMGDRVIVYAPRILVAEAEALIAMLDRPYEAADEQVMRTVMLEKTDAEQMTQTIQAMLSGQRSTPVPRRRGPRGRGKHVPVSAGMASDTLDVTVTPAPGGGAVVLVGGIHDVEEVEGWIKHLDEESTGRQKIVKPYDLTGADVEQVVDMLMGTVDSGAGVGAPQNRKAPAEDEDLFAAFDPKVERVGKDLYISADRFTGQMLVAATPTKMREVDQIVALFVGDEEGEGPLIKPQEEVGLPYMTYELANVDPFDAEYTLENILDAMWPYQDKPQIDYIPFTKLLVIKGNPEHFKQVEDLIVKYVDKGTGAPPVSRAPATITGMGMTAKDAAVWLKAQLESNGQDVEIVALQPDTPGSLEQIEAYDEEATTQPAESEAGREDQTTSCIIPPIAFDGLRTALAVLNAQPAEDEPPADEDSEDAVDRGALLRSLAGEDPSVLPTSEREVGNNVPADVNGEPGEKGTQSATKQPIRIFYNDRKATIVIEGSAAAVTEATDLIEQIKDEVKDLPQPPDIRIYRLKHIGVNKAADVLDHMFNDRQRRAQQAQMQRLQQQLRQQRARQRQAQRQRQTDRGGGDQQQPQPPDQQQEEKEESQPLELSVTVYPNARDRTIIIKAATEAFPAIEDLLKKIDRPTQAPMDYKIFTLVNNVAEEVEEQLRALLNQEQGSSRPRGRSAARRGRGAAGGVAQGVQDDMLQLEFPGGEGSSIAAEEITIASNPSTNSIMVMAPQEAMELVERFIKDMEDLNRPQFVTRTYELQHADAVQVVPQLEQFLGTKARGRGQEEGFDPTGLNAPMFMADGRTNAVVVRAVEADIPKIEPLIQELDRPFDEGERVQVYPVEHADATQLARTLQTVYADQGGRGRGATPGAKAVNIVGDSESNSLFVSAPPELQEEIAAQITKMDAEAAESITPHVIQVAMGRPTEIAKKIQDALGDAARGRKGRIKITGDDAGKQLLVVASDDMLPQIKSLVDVLDQAPEAVDIKIYPLEHAAATEVLQGLNQMVRQVEGQLRGRGIEVDVFSASADERSNSLVVMGGPMTFMLVEKVLKDLDVPPRDPTQVITAVYQLLNANAAEVARNINSVYGSRREKGVDPPKAEANPSSNIVLVRGTKAQVEEIYEQVIKPLEETLVADDVREVHYLENARASDVANTINQTLNQSRRRKGVEQSSLTVVANDPLNALLISGSEKEYEALVPLIQELDKKPEEMTGLVLEVYPVKYADPSSTISTINNSFPRLPGQKPEDTVRASYAWGTSSLVVAASPENQDKVQELLAKIDVESTTGRKVHIVDLEHANADELAHKLGEVYSRSRRRQRDEQPISFTSEPGTNSLLVYASEEEMKEIGPMIETLDVSPEFEQDRIFKTFQLTYAEAWEVKGLIDESFRQQRGRSFNPRDQVTTMAAWASNSLVISASPEKMEQIGKLIEQIDQKGTAAREVYVITVKHADAESVARALTDTFVRSTGGRRGQTIFISNPPGTDTLVVKANQAELAEIQQVVNQLDVAEQEVGGQIKVIPLKFTDATETLEILQEYLRKPSGGRGRRGDELAGDVRISAAPSTNSLVVAGDEEEIEHLTGIIAEIDVEVEDATNAPRIIKLQHAQASDIQPNLEALFEEQGRRGRGRGSATTMPPVIVADDDTNVLIVRASAVDYRQIEGLVEVLDSPEAGAGSGWEIVQLDSGVNAVDMAEQIDEILEQQDRNQSRGGRGRRGGGQQPERVLVSADLRTNALILSGPQSKFPEIIDLVRSLEQMGPKGGTVSQVIRLENIDPEEASRIIEQVVDEQKDGSSGRSRSRRGGRR